MVKRFSFQLGRLQDLRYILKAIMQQNVESPFESSVLYLSFLF